MSDLIPSVSMLLPLPFQGSEAASIASGQREDGLSAVGQDFEGIFYSIMLKELRNSLGNGEDGGLFPGDSSDILGGMFDLFFGQHLASSSQLGVAQMIERYLANRPDAADFESPAVR